MLAGLEDFKLGGLMEPEAVILATEEYRAAEDWLQRFLDSETTAIGKTQAKNIYERYKRWAEESKEYVQPERKFNDAMDNHGVESSKEHNRKMYHLTLKNHLENFMGTKGERMTDPREVL